MAMWIRSALALLLVTSALGFTAGAAAQSIERAKAGVVRISAQSDGLKRTGSGFVVRLENDVAFILTASHVIEGDNRPRVEFYTRRNTWAPAETVRIEGGDARGLALIAVRGKENLPGSIAVLPVSDAALHGGEPVTVIGFPQGGGAWAVLRANVVSMEGRELTLDGSIGEGNSGGPVLFADSVVGVVTTVGGAGGFGHAVPATILRLVLAGWGVQAGTGQPLPPSDRDGAAPRPGSTPDGTARSTPVDTGSAQARITRALCEKLRATTGFRISVYGESQGPEGARTVPSLLRDDKVIARPRISCEQWTQCTRGAGEPEKTAWKISVMQLPPAPTDAIVSVMLPGVVEDPQSASVKHAVALDCLLQ